MDLVGIYNYLQKHLDLLEMAKVIIRVHHSAGNGVPLGAEMKANGFKKQR